MTISDVVDAFNVTARALRFYEAKGLLDPQRRGRSRVYSANDCARLDIIMRARRLGFSLDDIKSILDVGEDVSSNVDELRSAHRALIKRRAGLQILREDIAVLLEDLTNRIEIIEGRFEELGAQIDEDEELRARAAAFQQLGRSWLWSDASG